MIEGDKVRLKSGGPDMVIVKIEGTRALCGWYSEFHTYFDHEFPLRGLVKVN
jgi:uncharacterized protein YodC (DUF2158 family)